MECNQSKGQVSAHRRCLPRSHAPAAVFWLMTVLFTAAGAAAQNASPTPAPLPALTNCIQVQKLSAATGHYPVELRGVMTFTDAGARYGFIQDHTAGTVVFWTNATPPAVAGQLVELEGTAETNVYAASIVSPVIHVLGEAPFPTPLHVSFDELNGGVADCQWTEIQGWVRSATTNGQFLFLSLSIRRHSVKVSVCLSSPTDPAAWVDTQVRIYGVAIGSFNGRGQFAGAELVSPSVAQIKIIEAAHSDPFALPLTSVRSLGHKSEAPPGSRIRIQGVVTLFLPGKALYVRDQAESIEVETAQSGDLSAGDRVDVIGFYERAEGKLVMEDGSFRRLGGGNLPVPVPATIETIGSGRYDSELVTLTARVLEWRHGPSERSLSLRGEHNIIFTARLDGAGTGEEVPVGSLVTITGVCQAVLDRDFNVKSFDLLLRSPADLVMIQRPPWWTAERIVWIAGGFGALAFGTLGWVSLLRRQVRRQTTKLQSEIEERKRLQVEADKTHRQLLTASRMAGMAEVATGVLHNAGNVLNSVNVSCSVVLDRVRSSKISGLEKAAALLSAHDQRLVEFLTEDPKGRRLPGYLSSLAAHLAENQAEVLKELHHLGRNVEHVKEIIAMQQSYAKTCGVLEPLPVVELVEEALRLDAASLDRHHVKVCREFAATPTLLVDRHKTLQILVNLIRNACHALDESGRADKVVTVRIEVSDHQDVKVTVADNGVGIPAENLTRIFGQGFSTRKDGHGFGLHSGALAAREMGGSLTVSSGGVGQGATFVLSLPMEEKSAIHKGAV